MNKKLFISLIFFNFLSNSQTIVMKKGLLTAVFLIFTLFGFSQNTEEVTKEVEVFETVEEDKRDVSVGVIAGPIKYLGEYASETEIGYGILIEKHYSPKFNMQYNIYKGSIGYTDSADIVQTTSYFGLDAMASINLIEAFANKEEVGRFSPYLSLGLGILNSKANHYIGNGQIDFSVPTAVGANFFASRKLSVGIDVSARYIFSDNLDNALTTAVSDLIITPGITLKYLVGQKRVTKRVSKYKSITYYKPVEEKKTYEKYVEPEYDVSYEPFVEVTVKDVIPEDNGNEGVTSNWTLDDTGDQEVSDAMQNNSSNDNVSDNTSDNNTNETNENYTQDDEIGDNASASVSEITSSEHLFYTVQVGSYPDKDYDLVRKKGLKQDYVFYNKELKLYNYLYGMYGSREEAERDARRVNGKVRGAFVVAIYKDERLSKREADDLVEKDPSIVNIEATRSDL